MRPVVGEALGDYEKGARVFCACGARVVPGYFCCVVLPEGREDSMG